jgi:hypothetical protein
MKHKASSGAHQAELELCGPLQVIWESRVHVFGRMGGQGRSAFPSMEDMACEPQWLFWQATAIFASL